MTALDAYEFVVMDHELGRSERFLTLGLLDGVKYQTGDPLASVASGLLCPSNDYYDMGSRVRERAQRFVAAVLD